MMRVKNGNHGRLSSHGSTEAVERIIVMVDFINHRRAEGCSMRSAIVESGCRRLRPVMLTTVTTVGGLTPIL
jgi:multidrug efflux pump subunit AcrB